MGLTSRRITEIAQARSVSTSGWGWGQAFLDHNISSVGAGVPVTQRAVAGIPAFDAAVGFAAESVAQTTMQVWRGDGAMRQHITDSWQAVLFRGVPNPTQDWFTFWYIVEASLTARRNAYIWKTKRESGHVAFLTALHPGQVTPSLIGGRVQWAVSFRDGYPRPPEVEGLGTSTVDASTLIHIRGRGGVGEILAPSPIQEFAKSLGVVLAKQEHESALYRNGVQGGMVVAFPERVNKEQAVAWREGFDAEHAGPGNIATTKVVPGGATITQIGMTQVEAQFAESIGLSLADVSRITNVDLWFLGAPDIKARPISPEHEMQRWMYRGLGPRLSRIESAVNADQDIFGGGTSYAAFDTTNVVRGDLLTEANIEIRKVQAGIWVPDEARAHDGLPPLEGGVGQIPQVTPVGGVPNDPALAPPAE
jgi:HK97 family phage portal protein